MRSLRNIILAASLSSVLVFLLVRYGPRDTAQEYINKVVHGVAENTGIKEPPFVKYLPEPLWTPPPIRDPFSSLETNGSPPVPPWNKPKKNIHKEYGIDYAPPLLIGFTRAWPILLQAVVSYITAGWPPEQIYVVENTGVQLANAQGKLTLQNPFYLNYKQLDRLGVKVVQAPVLMSFSQLQNYYTHLAHLNSWPCYFWSHMDVLVLSYEDGMDGVTPAAGQKGYKTVYELCLAELGRTLQSNERWANKLFSYDHLTLVNREAYEDVGGWDTFIPYYMNDCDMHSRLIMANWTMKDAKAGIITDVSTALDDFRAFYRDPSVEPSFTDPNPPPPPPKNKDERDSEESENKEEEEPPKAEKNPSIRDEDGSTDEARIRYYQKLKGVAESMFHYKHGSRGRNTWQASQRGGQGEPFYYPARGIAEAMDVLTEAGREVYRRKWGHRDCDLVTGTRLRLEDQWLVEKDWN